MTTTKRADYGLDRPDMVVMLLGLALLSVILGFLGFVYFGYLWAVVLVGFTASFVYADKVQKVRGADAFLSLIRWRGDESVLDVGCGRGLMLVSAARHLTTGRAVGIDIWNSRLQSGNKPERTLENARRERVSDRVEVTDGDARMIPFGDGSFDVVLSSLALHHVGGRAEREQAIAEIARVLRPGGYAGIIEIMYAAELARALVSEGFEVDLSQARFLLFFPVRTILARKPAA